MLLYDPIYAAIVVWMFASVAPAAATATPHQNSRNYINYTTVTGYFLQDEPSTNASTFDFTTTNFGLKNQSYPTDHRRGSQKTQWQRFAAQVSQLQREAPKNFQYKLLFLGRHGEGYHNAAESYYGTPAWNCYYSILNGNETVTWADPELTPDGVTQTLTVKEFWASQIETQKIPTPQSYYTSPLTRCLVTANLTFSGLKLPPQDPFVPTVKEFFREGISGHTCDRRRTKTYIQTTFPGYRIEEGFTETDELWRPLFQETETDQDIRSREVLDDVFSEDGSTYISITSHSGEIASLLRGTLNNTHPPGEDGATLIRRSPGPSRVQVKNRRRHARIGEGGDDNRRRTKYSSRAL